MISFIDARNYVRHAENDEGVLITIITRTDLINSVSNLIANDRLWKLLTKQFSERSLIE